MHWKGRMSKAFFCDWNALSLRFVNLVFFQIKLISDWFLYNQASDINLGAADCESKRSCLQMNGYGVNYLENRKKTLWCIMVTFALRIDSQLLESYSQQVSQIFVISHHVAPFFKASKRQAKNSLIAFQDEQHIKLFTFSKIPRHDTVANGLFENSITVMATVK